MSLAAGARSPAVVAVAPRVSNATLAWHRFRRNKLALTGLGIVLLLAVLAALGPILPLADPLAQNLLRTVEPPSRDHLLGTDTFGRDVLSRLMVAARVAFMVGFFSAVFAALIGVSLGLLAGYNGGIIDTILARVADTILTFPGLLLAMVVVGSLGPSVATLVVTLAVVFSPRYFRLARASALQLKGSQFVEAAHAIGDSTTRIILSHVLPNALSPVLVQFSLNFAYAIVAETSLSFLGLGIRPPNPSWGSMLNEARSYLVSSAWLAAPPAVALVLSVLSLNFVGDGLRDALDPRSSR